MLGTEQQGLLRYEERVRLERANDLRPKDDYMHKGYSHCPQEEEQLKGKDYATLAKTALKLNAVCPHTKVIVPVTPAFVIEEPVKTITAEYAAQPYKVVDYNIHDSRTGMLHTIPHSSKTEVKQAVTTETYDTVIEDTMFDTPNKVKTVKRSIKVTEDTKQPIAVNGTTDETTASKNGKDKLQKNPSVEVVE